MRKVAIVLSVLLASACSVPLAFAEDPETEEPQGVPAERPAKKEMKMDMMQDMMKGMHQKPTITVTPDGGVLVLTGNRLAKYDANLELVKEVELKGGPKPGDKKGMMKDRPMMMDGEPAAEEAQEAADNSEHEAHH